MNIKTILSILLIVALVLGSMFVGYKLHNPGTNTVYVNDTTYITKTDSFTLVKPEPYLVIKDTTIIDTLYSIDSVLVPVKIPLSLYHYKDTCVQAPDSIIIEQNILGYHVQVQNLTARLKTVSTVILPKPLPKDKRFMLGFQVGYSIDAAKPRPYIGIGLSYRIFSF